MIASLLGAWPRIELNVASVFYVGGAFALTGIGPFLVILVWFRRAGTLTE